jgi:hypothetical protein
MTQSNAPGCFVRGLWYIFIGWWAGGLALALGYLAILFIVTIPLGFWIFNRFPTILTLRPRSLDWEIETVNGTTRVRHRRPAQRPWILRAIYFVLIGWWFGAVWLSLAYLIGLLIVTLPLTFWMMNRTSGVMTLERH